MGIKSFFQVRKLITTKPVVFITGLLTLFTMANAYSLDEDLYIDNLIPKDNPHYSNSGYRLKPSGHGHCMYGVYHPASCVALYEAKECYVAIHYAASFHHGCFLKSSSQDFDIINNDTGKTVASLQWHQGFDLPSIRNIKDPEHIMADVTGKPVWYSAKNKLNIYAYK
ncbi:hypothetical protein [Candidatus Sororendozoicomonas aggregata]|uniref:hypothetical protein n=1 Tax=Candidatus Sororendozoicomonas aggregata TaxID=3073239 RepID=UPI002ED0DC39